MKILNISTPEVDTGLSETANVMVQIIPIFGVLMAMGAVSGKVNIKAFFGFIIAICFVVIFSGII